MLYCNHYQTGRGIFSFVVLVMLLACDRREAVGRPPVTHVTTNSDSALRAAVSYGGTVILSFNGTVALTNVIQVNRDVSIESGTNQITLDGGGRFQIFRVSPGIMLSAQNLTFLNGYADGLADKDSSPESALRDGKGGAILNEGSFAATQCIFSNNVAVGGQGDMVFSHSAGVGKGGVVFSTGNLFLTNCDFSGNQAIGGTSALGPRVTSYPAMGGAIFLQSGSGVFSNCRFASNSTHVASGYNGVSAGGGAFYMANGNLAMDYCRIEGNRTTGGDTGQYGGSGLGGGLNLTKGAVNITRSLIRGNIASGGAAENYNGGVGRGGGIYIDSATVTIAQTSVIDNMARPGNDHYLFMRQGPGIPSGGGIFNMGQDVRIINSTFAQNQAVAGTPQVYYAGAYDGSAYGAGIYNSGTIALQFSTLARNTNVSVGQSIAAYLVGDGIYNTGVVTLENSIVAFHPHGDFEGPIVDGGHNISSDSSGHFTTSLENIDPKLGPLADNGGPTLTMPLLDGSPAIDAGGITGPFFDQRGNSRPFGSGFDIGAVEQSPPGTISLQIRQIAGNIEILFTGLPEANYELRESNDLTMWTTAGIKMANQSGQAIFSVAPSGNRGFFVVRKSP
jgi:hypothetical protein